MELGHALGPDLESLRPLHAREAKTFPVYGDLARRLAEADMHPDEVVAHALAVCAGYAYGSASTVATMMARLGLDENHCIEVKESVDAMFICSTAFVVQSKCGRVAVLCYRGTEPVNVLNWLTDADTSPSAVSFFPASTRRCDIHSGFYRNVRATRYEVIAALQRALAGESVLPPNAGEAPSKMPHALEALYVTGHSLGGAMAATMGVMLATERDYAPLTAKLKGVYTYGQPMIGSPAFAEECATAGSGGVRILRDRMIRYVYRGDPVPALPPVLAGDFAHFGREIQLAVEGGRFRESEQHIPTPQMLTAEALQFVPAAIAPATQLRDVSFRYGPADHGPQNYIAALTPGSVTTTEFGDDAITAVRRPSTWAAWAVALGTQLARNAQARLRRRLEPLLGGAQDQVRHLGETPGQRLSIRAGSGGDAGEPPARSAR
jgi:hypothetical protein